MKIVKTLAAFLAVSGFACVAMAEEGHDHEHAHGDAMLIIGPTGELQVGIYDFGDGDVVTTDAHVFEGEFDEFGVSDEPGINALSSTGGSIPSGFSALPGLVDVTFTADAFDLDGVVANLWHWDGEGEVDFAPVSSGSYLSISKAPSVVFESVLDGSATDVDGFVIETTDATGFLHKHIDFALINLTGSVDEGVYLWSMSFEVDSLASEPVYFVHGFGLHDEEAHEAAVEYVEEALVPEPASAALVLIGLAAIRRR